MDYIFILSLEEFFEICITCYP